MTQNRRFTWSVLVSEKNETKELDGNDYLKSIVLSHVFSRCMYLILFLLMSNNANQLTNQHHSIAVDYTRICVEFLSAFESL